jgi:hypothetical protein
MFELVKQNKDLNVQRKNQPFFQAKPIGETAFFSPAPSMAQRDEKKTAPADATKPLTEGASVVKEQLDDQPGYKEWQDQQTDALKKKLWDDQPTELKAGIITFGLSSAGILGSAFAADPTFRSNTIKFLDDKNLALPLSLIPHHEYFPLSSFKYKLPSATQSPINFDTEFDFEPYMDLVRKKWSFIPKTGLTFDATSSFSQKGGFNVTGGSIKLKLGGGIVNLQGFVNSTLPVTPMLIQGNNPGDSPVWMMRTLPGQFEDQLPKGNGVFLTVDVMRVPQLFQSGDKGRDSPVQRKCRDCQDDVKMISRKHQNAGMTVSNERNDGFYQFHSSYQLDISDKDAIITINIRIVPDKGVTGSEVQKVKDQTRREFLKYWDNRFTLTDPDGDKISLRMRLNFVDQAEELTVALHKGSSAKVTTSGDTVTVTNEQEDQENWFVDSEPIVRAHELGHQLGMLDEYVDPASPNRVDETSPGVFDKEHSLMSDPIGEGINKADVKIRHGDRLAQDISNATRVKFTAGMRSGKNTPASIQRQEDPSSPRLAGNKFFKNISVNKRVLEYGDS